MRRYTNGMRRHRPVPAYRHSLVTRVTHAIFFVAFMGLVISGSQIYFHQHWLPRVNSLHQYFGLTMIASGLIYLAGGVLSGSLSKLLFGPRDAAGLVPMIAYYARLRKTAPVYADYNPLQKLAYTIVLLTMGPLMAATGLAMWPHLPLFRPLTQFFGGRKEVTLWHLGFGLELALFFVGHMVMVATTGLRNNLRAIITGWHHPSPSNVILSGRHQVPQSKGPEPVEGRGPLAA
jgi:thiosulfate reductase cytochrome b subunit